MNTPRQKPFVRRAERESATSGGVLAVRSSSFVSMLVSADAVTRHSLPIADYFIWNDDFEFSTRILRHSRGIFVPASVVVHKTQKLGASDLDPGERFYFEVRNKLWLMLHSRGLNLGEKLIYGASTIRRWAKTIRRSHQRAVLWRQLRRGLAAGIRRGPLPNAETLAGLGEISNDVAALQPSGVNRR